MEILQWSKLRRMWNFPLSCHECIKLEWGVFTVRCFVRSGGINTSQRAAGMLIQCFRAYFLIYNRDKYCSNVIIAILVTCIEKCIKMLRTLLHLGHHTNCFHLHFYLRKINWGNTVWFHVGVHKFSKSLIFVWKILKTMIRINLK
jgi:hypothetical protein